jgi:TPR repeat protein
MAVIIKPVITIVHLHLLMHYSLMKKITFVIFSVLLLSIPSFAYAHTIGFQNEAALQSHLQSIIPLAEKNDPNAQFDLAWHYEKGYGVKRDLAKAANLYKMAAEEKHSAAQYKMGLFYHTGTGLEQNQLLARRYMQKAAENEIHQAQYQYGLFYYKGAGGVQSAGQARIWWEKAAEQGNGNAMYMLYSIYLSGTNNNPINIKTAIEWLNKSARHGNRHAQYDIGFKQAIGTHGFEKSNIQSYAWLNISALQGNMEAKKTIDAISPTLSDAEKGQADILANQYYNMYVRPFQNMDEPFQDMDSYFKLTHPAELP